MSDEENEVEAPPPPPRKKRRLIGKLGAMLLVLAAGGAGAFYLQNAGYIDLGLIAAASDNRPHLVLRDDAVHSSSGAAGGHVDPLRYKVSYYPIEESFTSNLKDGEGLVQIGIGVSTYYDERVFQNVERHQMAIRSAVLLTLADEDASELASPGGKEELKADLKGAINSVLKAKEGFGGIDDVYFTSFVMQ